MINTLRDIIPFEEFDYQTLMDAVRGYEQPRDKISGLLRKGYIVRVKKGLYVFGNSFQRSPYSREVMANLIYGPSYISLEYAMQYHGLIPERVEVVTSVTTGRSRKFTTPVGGFSYRMIPLSAFRCGMDRIELDDGRAFLMATPEKALSDKLVSLRGAGMTTQKGIYQLLIEDMRISTDSIISLNPERIMAMADSYRSRRLTLLARLIERMKRSFSEVVTDA
jgi:hypothetical protein